MVTYSLYLKYILSPERWVKTKDSQQHLLLYLSIKSSKSKNAFILSNDNDSVYLKERTHKHYTQ